MSELKATPGPYYADVTTYPLEKWHETQVLRRDSVIGIGKGRTPKESAANAHLFAASWDLYHALKDADALVIGWAAHWAINYGGAAVEDAAEPTCAFNGWHPVHREIYQNLKAALAKARGEQ